MIDPSDIINFNRTQDELESFWLFCCLVAGKNATTQTKALDRLLEGNYKKPFDRIKHWFRTEQLVDRLKDAHTGQYQRLEKCFADSVNYRYDWKHVTIDQLEKIRGVGPKTSRFFIVYTQNTHEYAVLDTHILKYLRSIGYDAPKNTPPEGELYWELEKLFLVEARKSGKSVAEFDLDLWNRYSQKV